jgi:hypothetical protein
MKIPFLDQIVALERGEAHELQHVVGNVCLEVMSTLQSDYPVPMPAGLLLAFPVLRRLVTRLGKVAQQELFRVGRPRQPPVRFRLSYEEVVALMLHVQPRATSGFVVLGKVHQKSLNLEAFVRLTGSGPP